ncbi:toxin-activating lysine-acyltransferase [Roseinatronobacter alkalisoli]|uniref:RTX toxin-activating lysine-acyltransferase n=1 Tax=Roseinatronobacter alkalisoli TaxID=3028235 RepID=A0ABT5TFN1_9RHOB|nr:toxin-activating lysine-acyltransferase [Roseinatronobacter sp. HJB301]MDD7973821.1 toxin-activating lysine-acyltransferase [Roseinatronobacter sp. HJB301]
MVNIDYFASVGYALELLAQSPYHRQHKLGDYFRTEVLPALWAGQCRFYVTQEGVPTAMVTWAWLSEDVERDIHASGRSLSRSEWTCGDRLFFNDWITPYGNIREVAHDMTHNIFPD